MLSRDSRISRELWNTVLKAPKGSSKYYTSIHFTLRSAPPYDGKVRVAVSASKKVSKKAVVRNRVRRRTYVALRDMLTRLKPNLYLISAKPGSDNLKGEAIVNELEQLFNDFLIK